MAASPSQRDITQAPEDLSWRTSAKLVQSVSILAVLTGLSIFIFTSAAEQFARSPSFWPILMACMGVWAIYTVPAGLGGGEVQPFVRGIHTTFTRQANPKSFWASLIWNGLLGCFCIGFAYPMYADTLEQALEDRCQGDGGTHTAQDELAACNELITTRRASHEDLDDLMVARGNAYYRLKNYRRALVDYDEAIRLDPRDSASYFNRGLVYEELGDTRRALQNYGEAIRLKPDDSEAYLNRGLVFLNTAKFDEALPDFSRAHELDPKNPWPLANRGITYAWKNDRARAEADLKAARAIDPSNPVVPRAEGLLAMNSGDMSRAVSHLTEAIKAEPDNQWSFAMRAEAYRRLGEHEKARADIENMKKLRDSAKPPS